MSDGNSFGTQDPFTRMWSDMMGRMAMPGMNGMPGMTPPQPTPEMMDQMRKALFSSMTEQAEEYMRSEQFLDSMKKSMDNALAFKQQLNQFLQSGLQTMQMPTRSDSDHMVLLLRGMEERVLGKLEELCERVERLEQNRSGSDTPVSKSTRSKSKSRG